MLYFSVVLLIVSLFLPSISARQQKSQRPSLETLEQHAIVFNGLSDKKRLCYFNQQEATIQQYLIHHVLQQRQSIGNFRKIALLLINSSCKNVAAFYCSLLALESIHTKTIDHIRAEPTTLSDLWAAGEEHLKDLFDEKDLPTVLNVLFNCWEHDNGQTIRDLTLDSAYTSHQPSDSDNNNGTDGKISKTFEHQHEGAACSTSS